MIEQPPDFLVGSCGPHPANDNLVQDVLEAAQGPGGVEDKGVLGEEAEKNQEDGQERSHARVHSEGISMYKQGMICYKCELQEVRRRYSSGDGQYTDYKSAC